MDPLSLLTGSDNLYKYLFIGGLGLIVLSLFYPLNRKYEYATQRDMYNNEVKLLNYDIQTLDATATKLSDDAKSIRKELESIKSNRKGDIKRKQVLKDSIKKQFDSALSFRKAIDKKILSIEYNKVRIDTLSDHIKEFTKYETMFFWAGIVSTLVGVIGWFKLMKKAP